MKLFLFGISHFCEKASWALDLKGVSYEARYLFPGHHIPVIKRRCPRSTVPVLQVEDRYIQGSDEIIDFLDQEYPLPCLTPTDELQREETREWERFLDRHVGVSVRVLAYKDLLPARGPVLRMWRHGISGPQKLLSNLTYPFIARVVCKSYKLTEENAAKSALELEKAMRRLDEAYGQRPFLVGDGLTRADITAAALLANLVEPPQHPMDWGETPPEIARVAAPYKEGPTFRRVRQLYEEYRGRESVKMT